MKLVMPLKRFVVKGMNLADPCDLVEHKKGIKSFHNKLANGSIPRSVVKKIGKELYVDLAAWDQFLSDQDNNAPPRKPGRPRSI